MGIRYSYVQSAWRRYGYAPIPITAGGGGVDPDLGPFPKPTAADTGHYGTLTTYNGNITVTTAGTQLTGLDIHGWVDVRTSGVRLRNCKIRGDAATSTERGIINATHANCVDLVIEDCTIVPDTPSIWWTGVLGHDYTARRCNIYNCVDAFGVYNTNAPSSQANVNIVRNYAHDAYCHTPDSTHSDNKTHNDAVQIQGNGGVKVRYNNLDWAPNAAISSAGINPTACIMVTPNVSACPNMTFEYNWFGGSGVAAVINFSAKSAGPTSTASIFYNKFSRANTGYQMLLDTDLTFTGIGSATGLDINNGNVYEDNGAQVRIYRINI